MSAVVIDTDVWSFLFKHDTRAELYRTHLEQNVPCVSFQTVAELYQWSEKSGWGGKRRAQLATWLTRFVVLTYDDETARIWAYIRTERERDGRPLAAQDAWIAACALRYNYPLITHNASDYAGINNLVLVSEIA